MHVYWTAEKRRSVCGECKSTLRSVEFWQLLEVIEKFSTSGPTNLADLGCFIPLFIPG